MNSNTNSNNNVPPPPFSPGDNSVVAMVRCDECGHMVPEENLAIHQAHACGGRARRPTTQPTRSNNNNNSTGAAGDSYQQDRSNTANNNNVIINSTDNAFATPERRGLSTGRNRQRNREAAAAAGRANATGRLKRDDEHDDDNVIDLYSNEDDDDDKKEEVQVVEPPTASAANNNNSDEWACPRCTLLNPNSQSSCAACLYDKHASATSSQRRHNHGQTNTPTRTGTSSTTMNPPSPGAYVGGGALLGSVLGAAGAAIRGDSWVGGAMEGAMTGAMGGAFLGTAASQQQLQQQQLMAAQQQQLLEQEQQQQRRSSRRQHREGRPEPRSSIRVNRATNAGGRTTTTTVVYGPNGRVERRVVHDDGSGTMPVDPFMAFLMANAGSVPLSQQHPHQNIDGMSYEQLLQAFGDGSENRGATEAVISSLPVSEVTQDVPLEGQEEGGDTKKDHLTCPICLQAFQKGDMRKTLPCLHGFHEQCIDQWLRQNGSCPICKHVVSS